MKRHKQTRLCLEILEDRTTPSYGFGYALGLGSPGVDIGQGVAADAAGNATVVGSFAGGSIDLDPGPGSYELNKAGTGGDGFAASYDPNGTFRWGAHFASSAGNAAFEAAVDGNGNVFVTGSVGGTLEIVGSGGGPITLSATGPASFLAKFDASGNLLWARTLGEAGANHFAYGLATDAAGNVYATGDLHDGTDWMHQTFIAKYDGASGTTAWSRLIKDGAGIYLPFGGNTTYASGYGGIAVDTVGNVCITGRYLGTIDFDPDPTQAYWLTSVGNGVSPDNGDVFVLKLNASGGFAWAGSLGGASLDQVDAIAVDGAGNIYVDGYTSADAQNDFDPGPGTLQLPGGDFVVKIDPSGTLVWALGGIESSTGLPGKGMKVDAAGNIYMAGVFSGTMDADPSTGTFNLTSAGGQDILVSKLDSAGNFVWAAAMGGPGSDQGRAVALDGQGNIYATGLFQQTADFNPGAGAYNFTSTLDANGNSTSDVFISKLVPAVGATLPAISISDVTVSEGNTGTVSAVFTVTLSPASDQTVTVSYTSADGTATAASDYQAASGTLTFAPGETSKTLTVLVNGDRLGEPNETFIINLSQATNATIADSQGVATIVDDEPRISINDVTKNEGKRGQTTLFTFTVTLSAAYDQAVTMSFRTVDGSAKTSDNDYIAKTGTLTFAPGETAKTITIEVKGDSKREANEVFYLDLFGNSSNSLFTKNSGLGTILNDDR